MIERPCRPREEPLCGFDIKPWRTVGRGRQCLDRSAERTLRRRAPCVRCPTGIVYIPRWRIVVKRCISVVVLGLIAGAAVAQATPPGSLRSAPGEVSYVSAGVGEEDQARM